MADEQKVLQREARDGREIPDGIVRDFGKQARVHAVRAVGAEDERVAARSAFRNDLGAYLALN